MNINTAQFGVAVSAYAFSAGISGLMTAGFADKYDRKKLLLFFYIGFVILRHSRWVVDKISDFPKAIASFLRQSDQNQSKNILWGCLVWVNG